MRSMIYKTFVQQDTEILKREREKERVRQWGEYQNYDYLKERINPLSITSLKL